MDFLGRGQHFPPLFHNQSLGDSVVEPLLLYLSQQLLVPRGTIPDCGLGGGLLSASSSSGSGEAGGSPEDYMMHLSSVIFSIFPMSSRVGHLRICFVQMFNFVVIQIP